MKETNRKLAEKVIVCEILDTHYQILLSRFIGCWRLGPMKILLEEVITSVSNSWKLTLDRAMLGESVKL